MSRGFTLRMSFQPIGIPMFLRHAITCINIKDFDSRRVKMLKTGFPNLKRVMTGDIGLLHKNHARGGTIGLEFRRLLKSKTLLPILQGKHDQDIGDKLQEAWDSALSVWDDPECLNGLIIMTQIYIRFLDHWLLQGCPCILTGDILCFYMELRGSQCHLTRKTIQRPRRDGTGQIEATDRWEQCSHAHSSG
ncbi:hypothetical protein PMZ80_007188 [Knufia obscura]|uniref:Uncharacterized protein n=1 Tax=Knufia obscura TaxID=1635080 RepID=A0ABR0RJH9_9EURO|nr:hypothetical protein PMZ80_007188 [Knufia obscura]